MGQDADGLHAILRLGSHDVTSGSAMHPAPRLADLPTAAADEVMAIYTRLGGLQASPALRPGSWDMAVDGILVELDEQLHFNRYRELTLTVGSYEQLPRFPLSAYRSFCKERESDCLKPGRAQGRWMNDSTERHFGPSAPRGELAGRGSSRWKQRAVYDLMKDLTQLDPQTPRLARIAIWDLLPGTRGISVEQAVHQAPNAAHLEGVRRLIQDRAGRKF